MTRSSGFCVRLAAGVVFLTSASVASAVDVATPQIVTNYPHDTEAFTQGFLLQDGAFYESTGLYGSSSLRRVDRITGAVQQQLPIDAEFFAEGLARVDDRLIQLTWQENVAWVYDIDTFQRLDSFSYGGEGWGLCYDGTRLVMTDGSSILFFRDPDTFELLGQIQVTKDGVPVNRLNELECVGRLVYANVWLSDSIMRIDPATGMVLTEIDARGLLTPEEQAQANVLNGIAFDPATEHFFLTGKFWPKVFEVVFDFDPYGFGPCDVRELSELEGLTLGKDGFGGITFSWNPDPWASEYHVNSVSVAEHIAPPGPHRMDVTGAYGIPECEAQDPFTSCTDPNGETDPEPVLFYQVFSACGPAGADEGPP